MFCVVTETEYYGPYGPAGVSYLRESKDREQRSFLFPGGDASIKLDCAGGRYEIRNIDGELLFLATVKNVYSSEIGYVRELFNRAMDCAVEYGAKNAMIECGKDVMDADEFEKELSANEKAARTEKQGEY
ncbi:hypothetical protein ACG2QI_02395 [Bacillus sp. GM2]|uniref:hypothetical protein n=1 Tax=Bacillus TaxID=1386 RepID=UPI00084B73AF|nr:hypothetical protein [Bacillus licheniformis]AOP16602.1 hypothetical protein BL1202_03681 [Bacillus licheniformis]MDQ9097977.1 hypothetical protein [Bacillus licheniformis]MEC0478479.1 hypothetical protein [Bacillus licheniformis]MEC0492637.1 hypothetical protein [Bacillus licheniformis]QAW30366.1 hypothetical protein ETA57_18135 [Bacillus licheniformis]